MKCTDINKINLNEFEILRIIYLIEEKIDKLTKDSNETQNEKFKESIKEYVLNLKDMHTKMQKYYIQIQSENTKTKSEKEIVLNTISEVVNLIKNPCSFRKFMENIGLKGKDYEDLYNAGGMYLVDISNLLDEMNVDR